MLMKTLLKGRLEAMHKIVMEITLLIMEISWNCVFEFLWESCYKIVGFIIFLFFVLRSFTVLQRTQREIHVHANHNESFFQIIFQYSFQIQRWIGKLTLNL